MFKKSNIAFLVIISILVPNTTFASFKDVGTFHTYQESINKLAETKCISGYPDNTFKPDNNINRAEVLKLIMNCSGVPKIFSEESFKVPAGSSYLVNGQEVKIDKDTEIKIKVPFDPKTYPALEFRDLNNTEWFIDILKEALVRKIITGYADNTIKATRTVTKGEFFSMLYRIVPTELQKVDLSKDLAPDAQIGQWYTEGLAFAVQNNIIGLDAEGKTNPFREITRGQAAHFIYLYRNWLAQKNSGTPLTTAPTTEQPSPTPTETTPAPSTPVPTTPIGAGFTEEGIASFISRGIAGQKTASGDLFNPDNFTAAHKTIPFGTIVKVTNPENGKWVKVSINDRGPFVDGRIIDLSTAAFEGISELSKGITKVKIEILAEDNQ
jgi:rare lipoprotein A